MKRFLLATLLICEALPAQDVGAAAASSAATAQENHWQNWTFMGTLLVIATGAILAVSLDNGKAEQSH